MPLLKLTPYEIEHDLLPRLCGKCGEPADDRVRFNPVSPSLNIFMGVALIACPPVFVGLAMILTRRMKPLFMPMCATHRADWEWRDWLTTITYLPVAILYCVAIALLVYAPLPPYGYPLVGVCYWFVWSFWIAPASIMWTRTVRSTGLPKKGIQLSGVHSNFVQAILEDRARDINPERMAWFGDERDDFDDELKWQVPHNPDQAKRSE
jgi:hypothetical protein